ncbi:membrane protein [Arthrobacter phage Lewando]|nr:membrane protein [Arthrobacter phage Lewando]
MTSMTGLNLLQKLQRFFPLGYKLFLKIAEPRVVRLAFFTVYICMTVGGATVFIRPPRSFQNIEIYWLTLNLVLAAFLILGGILSSIAVLPGIWWLERTGLAAMITAMLLFSIFASGAYGSITLAIAILLALRWREIRRYQLAPLKSEPRKE